MIFIYQEGGEIFIEKLVSKFCHQIFLECLCVVCTIDIHQICFTLCFSKMFFGGEESFGGDLFPDFRYVYGPGYLSI